MSENSSFSRRQLFHSASAGVFLSALPAWFAARADAEAQERRPRAPRRIGPSDTLRVGVIGPGGSKGGFRQGLGDARAIQSQPGVKVVAACDVDLQHLEEAADAFGPGTRKYVDFRYLLARDEIDAVVIGTPDHWHAVIAGHAMRAGKDVYCEKPLTLTIDQGKQLVKLARQTGAVFQVGSQQRSDARFRLACELVRNGRIGKLTHVEAYLPGAPKGGPFETLPPPPDLLWDMWLGPAPEVDYMPQRCHGSFRWWLDYSGGILTDWGAHHLDIAQWGIGADGSGPVKVEGTGESPVTDPTRHSFDVFPAFDITFTYGNGVTLLCTNKGENGVKFVGEDGRWIFVSRGRIGASDEKLLSEPLPASALRLYASDNHHRNFVDCVRARTRPICDVEVGHRSVTLCHLANICLQLGGKPLAWDPRREVFKDAPDANAKLARPMRGGWTI